MSKKIFVVASFTIIVLVALLVCAADYYGIADSDSSVITEHTVSKNVVNDCGKTIFVPTKTAAEWSSFVDNSPACAGVYCPNGEDNGLCSICDGTGGSSMPTDDASCGTIDCDDLDDYSITGTQGAMTTSYCELDNYADLTSGRCEDVGDCKDANTADCDDYSTSTTVTAGTCDYVNGCSGSTSGSIAYYGTSTACSSTQDCDFNNYYHITGTQGTYTYSYCKYENYADTTRKCNGGGACSALNCGSPVQSNQATAGLCQYITGCTGSTAGTVKSYCSAGEYCDGGTCYGATTPYLFTYIDGEYLVENDIMNTYYQKEGMTYHDVRVAYENGELGDSFEEKDIYKLTLNPTIEFETIKLQIRELEPEESNIDELELIRVVHREESYAFADIPLSNGKDGAINIGKNIIEISPIACIDEEGVDCLDLILNDDVEVVEKADGESLIIEFDAESLDFERENYFYFNAWGKEIVPRLITSPLDDGYSKSMVMSYLDDLEWKPIGQDFHPRAVMRLHAVRAEDYSLISEDYVEDGKITLKINWTSKHRLDKFSIVSFSQETEFKMEKLEMISANHSRYGDVLNSLINQNFEYAHTVRGDIIDLEFDAGEFFAGEGEVEDYFLVARGYYHGLRTYMYPDVDTSHETFEAELDEFVKEYNKFVGGNDRELPYNIEEVKSYIVEYNEK